jgi:hypothetical protein
VALTASENMELREGAKNNSTIPCGEIERIMGMEPPRVEKGLYSLDNSCRYLLGKQGKNPVFCIGANPSTAVPGFPDHTIERVKPIAQFNGYDGWWMLNVYPQIATNPKALDITLDAMKHQSNLDAISKLVPDNAVIWAAWGNLLLTRPYLINCVKALIDVLGKGQRKWVKCGTLTQKDNPRHPLFLKVNQHFTDFNVKEWLDAH